MAVIVVNGTPIQPKIDSAQSGDTLDVKAGGYAGRLKITKPISIKGDGGATLEGGTGDGSSAVNADVNGIKNVIVSGLDLRHAGYAFRFRGDCTGSLVENCSIPVVDWMYRGTGTAQTGGNAFVFEKAWGIEVRHNEIRKCRAPSSQYVVDGGPFEFFSAQKINVHHNEIWDCVNAAEFGKASTDPNNSDIKIEDNIFHGRADPLVAVPAGNEGMKLLANGILLRALSGGSIQRNIFDLIDYWALNFDIGGTYGAGGFANITVRDNVFRLAPGSNRMLYLETGIPLSVFAAFDGNKVFTTSPSSRVAEVNGVRYLATDLAKFRTDTGFEKTVTWTVGPLPPIVPTPPPPPVDPCAAIKADRDALVVNLAAANATIATADGVIAAKNQEIAALKDRIAKKDAKSTESLAL